MGKSDISDMFNKVVRERITGKPGLKVSNYHMELVNNSFLAKVSHRGETLKCVAKFHRYTKLREAKTATMEVKCK